MNDAEAMQRMMANPSIERTCPGKPGHASHLKLRRHEIHLCFVSIFANMIRGV